MLVLIGWPIEVMLCMLSRPMVIVLQINADFDVVEGGMGICLGIEDRVCSVCGGDRELIVVLVREGIGSRMESVLPNLREPFDSNVASQ